MQGDLEDAQRSTARPPGLNNGLHWDVANAGRLPQDKTHLLHAGLRRGRSRPVMPEGIDQAIVLRSLERT